MSTKPEHNLHTPLLISSLTGHTQRADSHCSTAHRATGVHTASKKHWEGLKPTECSAHRAVARLGSNPAPQVTDNILWNYSREEAVANFMYFTITINRDEYHPPYLIGQHKYPSRPVAKQTLSRNIIPSRHFLARTVGIVSPATPPCLPVALHLLPGARGSSRAALKAEGCDGSSLEHLDSGTSGGTSTCSTSAVWFDSD